MSKIYQPCFLIIILITIFLSSCASGHQADRPSLETRITAAEPSKTIKTASPTFQSTFPVTATVIKPSSTPKPSPTISTDFTHFNSDGYFSVAQKDTYFRKAMEGSESCHWPCFGGVTPGKTTWDETVHVLGAFVEWGNVSTEHAKYWTYQLPGEQGWYNGYVRRDDKGILGKIRVSTSLETNILKVNKVLELYGQPSEVYLHPEPVGFGPIGLLQLVIVYQDRNAILYYEWDEKQVGNSIMGYDGSPSHKSIMALSLIGEENFRWTPDAVADAVITYDTKPKLIPISEISNMTVEQFTRTFIDPNATQTIIISVDAIK